MSSYLIFRVQFQDHQWERWRGSLKWNQLSVELRVYCLPGINVVLKMQE
jgi:hypothetical protein